ncbi:MAG: NMD3-related protein [Candidatus Methanospirareceae archaeon]
MRGKREKFCPKCGRRNDEFIQSLCKECFLEEIKLLEVGDLEITVCKRCNNYFKGRKRTSVEKEVEDFVKKEIRRRYGYDVKVRVEEEERRRGSVEVSLDIEAEIEGVRIEERGKKRIILKRSVCERCNKQASGYYEAIVQIRAKDRVPTEEEEEIATEIAHLLLGEADFISKIETLREGLDLYVSSIECGRKISREISKRLGGNITESRKLYGRKEGRNVYRVTFSVRLPTERLNYG